MKKTTTELIDTIESYSLVIAEAAAHIAIAGAIVLHKSNRDLKEYSDIYMIYNKFIAIADKTEGKAILGNEQSTYLLIAIKRAIKISLEKLLNCNSINTAGRLDDYIYEAISAIRKHIVNVVQIIANVEFLALSYLERKSILGQVSRTAEATLERVAIEHSKSSRAMFK